MKRFLIPILQLIGYLVLVLVVTMTLMGLTKTFIGDWESGDSRLGVFGEGALSVLGIAIANLLIFVLARSTEVFRGWPRFGVSISWFARGCLIGLVMAISVLLLTLMLGGARLSFDPGAIGEYLRYVIPFGGCLLIASLAEEWLFRGYPLAKLAGVFGRGWANLAMALLFAAAHLGSAGANPMVHINIVLGSLIVGALRFTRGGIPAAWGFHFAWNFTQVLLGANLSLEGIDIPAMGYAPTGSTLLSGGSFGPEAGIGATIITIGGLVLFTVYFRRQRVYDLPVRLPRLGAGG